MRQAIIKTKNNKEYFVDIAHTKEEQHKGLSGTGSMPKDKGMLFVWPEAVSIYMVMKDMVFDLDFIFISEDYQVLDIKSATKGCSCKVTSSVPFYAVLEINAGEGKNFKVGDILSAVKRPSLMALKTGGKIVLTNEGLTNGTEDAVKIGDVRYDIQEKDIKAKQGHIQLLDENGVVIKNMKGGNFIFSIPDTKELYEKSLLVDNGSISHEELGNRFIDMLKIQEESESLFVKN